MKYELIKDQPIKTVVGKTLYRIRALQTLEGVVEEGQLGGYIEQEFNLAQDGGAWVSDNARVSGNAQVSGNARVRDNA